jgi:RNA polymerase sigma-70 factor, ECF subfamily
MTAHSQPQPTPQTSSAAPGSPDRDQQEFMRLLVAHERRLEGFIVAMVADWAVADDIAQETKLRLWEQFPQFDRRQDFGAWARAIAYYQVLSYRKRHKRSREQLFSEQFLQNVAQEESAAQDEILSQQRFLASCFKKLNERSRHLLSLVYSGHQTMRQIAQRLGRSEAAVYKAVQYARGRLHRCIDDELRRERPK